MTASNDLSDGERASDVASPNDEQPPRRSSALAAVGMITAIAVLAAAAPIIWARLSAAEPADARDRAVPETLADGSAPPAVPDAVAGAVGHTIIAAAQLEDPTPLVEGCGLGDADVRDAFMTADYATLLARTDEPPADVEDFAVEEPGSGDTNVACVAAWRGDGWRRVGVAARQGFDFVEPAWLCCDERGRSLLFHTLQVHEGAAWLLEDRGTYSVAYDVGGRDTIGLVARSPEGPGSLAHLWWVDAGGTIVGEAYLGESFFGAAGG